jgi:hypothetical protein
MNQKLFNEESGMRIVGLFSGSLTRQVNQLHAKTGIENHSARINRNDKRRRDKSGLFLDELCWTSARSFA